MHLLVNYMLSVHNSPAVQSPLQNSLAPPMKTKKRRRNLQFGLVPLRKGAAQAQNHQLPLRSLPSILATPHNPLQQPHLVRSQLTPYPRPPQLRATHHLSLLRNLPSLLPQRVVHHPLSLPKCLGMPALPRKVLNLHQLLGPAERFLLLPHPRIVHMPEQRGINHILTPHLVGQGGLVVLSLRGGDLGLELLLREVILGPGPLSGVGPGLHKGGEDLEVPRDVAVQGLLSDQVGLGAEIHREEAGLGQQGEEDHTLDPQPLGADLVLERQLGGVGLALEHLPEGDQDPELLLGVGLDQEHLLGGEGLGQELLLGADLGPVHLFEGGLVVDLQQGEVAGPALEPQPEEEGPAPEPQLGEGGPAPEPQLGVVVVLALEPQPGEGGPALEHQQDEDLAVEALSDVEDLSLEHHKEEEGLAHPQSGRTNVEHLRGGAGLTQAQK